MIRIGRQHMRALRRHWSGRSLAVAGFATLIVLLIVSGPWACVAHCALMDQMQAHAHAAHAHHAAVQESGAGATCPVDAHGTHRMAEDPPSALTLAVILTLLLLPSILAAPLLPLRRSAQASAVVHAPPHAPPRASISFA